MFDSHWSIKTANTNPLRANWLYRLGYAVTFFAVCGTFAIFGIANANAAPQNNDLELPEWIRGSGDELEVLLSGSLKRDDGRAVEEAVVSVAIKHNSQTFETLTPEVTDGQFQTWLPIGKYRWYSVVIEAQCDDGARVSRTIVRQQLRQIVKNGLSLVLASPSKTLEIQIDHEGVPINNADVKVELQNGFALRCVSNKKGIAKVRLIDDETIYRVTAWSHQGLIGGLSRSDTQKNEAPLKLPMHACRAYEIEVQTEDGKPIAGADIVAYSYNEDRVFFMPPDSFQLTTNEQGKATFPWFPDLDGVKAYAAFVGSDWFYQDRIPSDHTYKIVGKRSSERHLITGKVNGEEFVGGFAIKLGSFQHEQEGRIDFAYAITNPDGSFSAEVLPDATYAVFLEDDLWVANAVDLIGFESTTGIPGSPKLTIEKGVPVRIELTQGNKKSPMPNTFANINSDHDFSWMEDGRRRSGSLGRNANDSTDKQGVIEMVAPEGTLEVAVYLSDWRGSKEIEVQRGQSNVVRIHRKINESVTVKGQVVAWKGTANQVANLQVHAKGIDGESGDNIKVKTDDQGRFEFETTASSLGAIVFTEDKKFAGSVVIKDLGSPAEIQLLPTKSYSGKILDPNGQPVANHKVWASIVVKDVRKFGTAFPTAFYTRIEQQTDANGEYRLAGLPCKTEISLGTDTLERKPNQFQSIDEVYFLPDDQDRSSEKTIGDIASKAKTQTLAERYAETLRDCKLNNFHLMVILYDPSNKSESDFVNRHLMDYASQEAVSTYMQLKVNRPNLDKPENKEFIADRDWEQHPGITAVVFDGRGSELGRLDLDPTLKESAVLASKFIEENQPAKQDALVKWQEASARAEKEGKRVWIRTGSRYCGPCFRLSRWLDDHREVIEKDFILVKVDSKDANSTEVSQKLSAGRSVGVPFHAIFDPNETRVTDSYGPIGNIGAMGGLEGKRHFRKMMEAACRRISEKEIDELVDSIEE